MIVPLVLGARRFDRPDLRAEALGMARHLVRSAWQDSRGRTRYHRYWYVHEKFRRRTSTPMLIAGMGLSLYGIDELLLDGPDAELSGFVQACLAADAEDQSPA